MAIPVVFWERSHRLFLLGTPHQNYKYYESPLFQYNTFSKTMISTLLFFQRSVNTFGTGVKPKVKELKTISSSPSLSMSEASIKNQRALEGSSKILVVKV